MNRPLLCGEIPEDGCPIGRGGTCDDEVCAALYDCTEGNWVQVVDCEWDGSSMGGGGAGSGDGGAGGCEPLQIDRTGEAVGCLPALRDPDCPVAAADMCEASVCLTGCEDFFLCTEQGWREVAYCSEDGEVVLIQ
ncbi:hypothetical protein [Chondromyces crocatus]|uniref:hypothetical protein n=1 Tax=Chondromyces crocatus TaxID=52 RepID=UPI0012E12618|nr:hypothetical protein [Chondromyces crocatus]